MRWHGPEALCVREGDDPASAEIGVVRSTLGAATWDLFDTMPVYKGKQQAAFEALKQSDRAASGAAFGGETELRSGALRGVASFALPSSG